MPVPLFKKGIKVLTLIKLQKRILNKQSLNEAFVKSIDDKSDKLKLLKKFEIELLIHKSLKDIESNINTDSFKLQHILNNLIDNAIKFTEKGKIVLSYEILNQDTLQFSITDTGIGIREETQKVIFDAFS